MNIVIMALIVLGGLGFYVLDELYRKAGSLLSTRRAPPFPFTAGLFLA